ncbi:MAG: ATP synthase F1 subunit epsilon [Oscillospiraceae bacterium]|nr:ATP synthase F1 subunit epsilon [Oscillospiraceae bacterium]
MTPFKLQIITPRGVFFKGETENVIARTTVGDVGILAKHEPYVAALGIGKVRIKIDGQYRLAAVSSGILKVGLDKTTILAQSCEWGDKIDVERAEEAKKTAEKRLSDVSLSANEHAVAEFKLKRALNRLDAAGK